VKTIIQGLPLPLGGLKFFSEMDARSRLEVALVIVWGICVLLAILYQLRIRISSAASFAEAHRLKQGAGVARHKVIIGCLLVSFRHFCYPTASHTFNMWVFLRIGAWGFQAVGIGLLIRFGVEFNGEMMDNLNPYYEVYDDPYSHANYVLGKKVSGRTHK